VGRLEADFRPAPLPFQVILERSKAPRTPSGSTIRKGQPGRPRKPARKRLSLWIRVRLSEEDLGTLRSRAGGQPISTYLRQAGLGRDRRSKIPAANLEIAGQLARVGNNVNQLVRLAHTGRYPVQFESVLRQLCEMLAKYQRELLGSPR
jgi:hypothetical protein